MIQYEAKPEYMKACRIKINMEEKGTNPKIQWGRNETNPKCGPLYRITSLFKSMVWFKKGLGENCSQFKDLTNIQPNTQLGPFGFEQSN